MKRRYLFIIGVLAVAVWFSYAPALASARMADRDSKSVEDAIARLERTWVSAIVNNDVAMLDLLLADDFKGTSPTAHTYSKKMAIADLKSGTYVVTKMNLDQISVAVYGNTAVAFTKQEEKSMYDGKDVSGYYYFTDVWVKNNGRWQVVASHGSRFDEFEPADF
jgi:ketosteroid isomerase-like protein